MLEKKPSRKTPQLSQGAACKPHYLKLSDNVHWREEEHFVWLVADDTMAPEFQPGDCVVAWSGLRPEAGDAVVVRTQDGGRRLCRYAGTRKAVIAVVFEHWRNMRYRGRKAAARTCSGVR